MCFFVFHIELSVYRGLCLQLLFAVSSFIFLLQAIQEGGYSSIARPSGVLRHVRHDELGKKQAHPPMAKPTDPLRLDRFHPSFPGNQLTNFAVNKNGNSA